MSPLVVAAIAGAIVAVLAWLAGAGLAALVVFPGVMAFAWQQARQGVAMDGPSSSAPAVVVRDASIDIGEELLDLLASAPERAARSLEDEGRLVPFVMYEDAQGSVRIRQVDAADGREAIGRAREAARSVDPAAPRLVLAVEDRVVLDGRTRAFVRYEAAERRFRDRTFVFVQPIRPRRLVLPATTEGLPIYVGEAEHALRFAKDSA